MKKILKFPEDFQKRPHLFLTGVHYAYPGFGNAQISIILGDMFYSNGVDTYEVYDFREDEPVGYLTEKQVNEYLAKRPV